MPSISKTDYGGPLTTSAIATVGHPNDDIYKMKVIEIEFNCVYSKVKNSVDLNSKLIDGIIYILEWVLEELGKQEEQQVFDRATIFNIFKNIVTHQFDRFYNLYFPNEEILQLYTNSFYKCIDTIVADSYEHYINDYHKDTVNEIIAMHLYRQGLFDVADMFVDEAGVEELTDEMTGLGVKLQFKRLQDITNAVKNNETELPLQWIAENREMLGDKKATELEYKIHVNKYLSIVEKSGPGRIKEALNYGRLHLKRFADENNRNEMSQLSGCLMFESSELRSVADFRYLHFFDGSYQRNLIAEIEESFYIMMGGQCLNDPLHMVTSVGAQLLSGVCKAANIATEDYFWYGWAGIGELPLYVNLGEELEFHSQFACPRVRVNMENGFNPPVALDCNHVCSFKMINCYTYINLKLTVCPFCHSFTSKGRCKTIKF